jgi:hypothetical protein
MRRCICPHSLSFPHLIGRYNFCCSNSVVMQVSESLILKLAGNTNELSADSQLRLVSTNIKPCNAGTNHMRCEVLTAVKVSIVVLWVATPYSLVAGYRLSAERIAFIFTVKPGVNHFTSLHSITNHKTTIIEYKSVC